MSSSGIIFDRWSSLFSQYFYSCYLKQVSGIVGSVFEFVSFVECSRFRVFMRMGNERDIVYSNNAV